VGKTGKNDVRRQNHSLNHTLKNRQRELQLLGLVDEELLNSEGSVQTKELGAQYRVGDNQKKPESPGTLGWGKVSLRRGCDRHSIKLVKRDRG